MGPVKPAAAPGLSTGTDDEYGGGVCQELVETLEFHMHNMERSLRCNICLSTFNCSDDTKSRTTDYPVVLSGCMHAYCKTCFDGAMMAQKDKRKTCCPSCQQPTSRRSIQSAPQLAHVARAYKKLCRALGLAPLQYEPKLLPNMTQLMDDDDDDEEEDTEEEEDTHHLEQKVRDALMACQVSHAIHQFVKDPQEHQHVLTVNQRVYKDRSKKLKLKQLQLAVVRRCRNCTSFPRFE